MGSGLFKPQLGVVLSSCEVVGDPSCQLHSGRLPLRGFAEDLESHQGLLVDELAPQVAAITTGGIFPIDSGYMAFKADIDIMGAMQTVPKTS